MATNDTLPLEEMLQSEGWAMARREIERKAVAKSEKLLKHRYASLEELREDQAELRILRQFLGKEADVLQFLTPRG